MKPATKIVLGVIVVGAAVGGSAYAIYRITRPAIAPSRAQNPTVYARGETVSPKVLALAHPMIDTDALADFVLNLEPKAQVQAYHVAHRIWTKDFAGSKEDLVRRVLHEIAPDEALGLPRNKMSDRDGAIFDAVAWLVELMGASVEEQAREPLAAAGGAR